MTNTEIAEILKFSKPNIIYVVTWNNILKKVFCPFKVKAKCNLEDIAFGKIYLVEAVKVDLKIETIFIINKKAYYYHNFDIIID